jgi:hypothetical protein
MKKIMFVFSVGALLGGCATPGVREIGVQSEHTLQLPPLKAAQCVAQNVKDVRYWYQAQIQGVTFGLEVGIFSFGKKIAVADIRPAEPGSTASIFQEKSWFRPSGLAAAMVKGC